MDDLYVPDPALLRLTLGGIVAWFLLLGAIRVVRAPRRPRPGPETTDLGAESPAVANLVTHRFKLTRDAVPATLVDLAARGVVEIEDRGIGDYWCRLKGRPSELAAYERMLVDHLGRKAANGVVPAGALTTGPQDASKAWWRDFRKHVVAEAQASGLSRNLWDLVTTAILFFAAGTVALLYLWATGFNDPDNVTESTLLDVVTISGGAMVAALVAAAGSKRQTDTEAGRRAAARWLGVREAIESSPSFAVVPPSGVVVWERHLAYAAALGVAPRAVGSLPMGAESDSEAWTTRGGEWRKVLVRYPRLRPGWGRHPALAILIGGLGSFAGYKIVGLGAGEVGAGGGLGIAALVAVVAGTAIFVRSAPQLLMGLLDVTARRKVEGTVLRARTRWGPIPYMTQSDDRQYVRCYVAIDDGRADVLIAYRVSTKVYDKVRQGAPVELEVSPRLGYVGAARSKT
ncbi:MAG TPA: hypothetical protein VG318_11770 [Actinomycetota bacterium]|nr:hypothetical protein [Actinomycetota bacterium]